MTNIYKVPTITIYFREDFYKFQPEIRIQTCGHVFALLKKIFKDILTQMIVITKYYDLYLQNKKCKFQKQLLLKAKDSGYSMSTTITTLLTPWEISLMEDKPLVTNAVLFKLNHIKSVLIDYIKTNKILCIFFTNIGISLQTSFAGENWSPAVNVEWPVVEVIQGTSCVPNQNKMRNLCYIITLVWI